MYTPACAHAHDVRPEQSKPVCGDASNATYGTPSTLRAADTARPALPDGGGGRGMFRALPDRPPLPRGASLVEAANAAALAAARCWASWARRSASCCTSSPYLAFASASFFVYVAINALPSVFFCASVAISAVASAC